MVIDRSTKFFLALFTLVAALALTINHALEEAPLADYWLEALLFLISFGLWVWLWLETQEESDTTLAVKDNMRASTVQEWTIPQTPIAEPTAEIVEPEHDVVEATQPEPVVVETGVEKTPQSAFVVDETTRDEAEASTVAETPQPAEEVIASAEIEQTLNKAVEEDTTSDVPDDLERVEGIGQKYKEALVAEGVDTFEKLAALSVDEIEQRAKNQGMRRRASMNTWAEQAALAAKGEWDKLDALQEELTGGRRG